MARQGRSKLGITEETYPTEVGIQPSPTPGQTIVDSDVSSDYSQSPAGMALSNATTNPKDIIYGKPSSDALMNGKKFAANAAAHKILGKIEDASTISDRLDQYAAVYNQVKSLPPFALQDAIPIIKGIREAQTPVEIKSVVESALKPQMPPEGQQAEIKPPTLPVPPQYITPNIDSILSQISSIKPPEMEQMIDPTRLGKSQRAMLIASVIGSLISGKSDEIPYIINAFANPMIQQMQQRNQQAMSAYEAAKEIAKLRAQMELDQIKSINDYYQDLYRSQMSTYNQELEQYNINRRAMASRASSHPLVKDLLSITGKDSQHISAENIKAKASSIAEALEAEALIAYQNGDVDSYQQFKTFASMARSLSENIKPSVADWKQENAKEELGIKKDTANARIKMWQSSAEEAKRLNDARIKRWDQMDANEKVRLDLMSKALGLSAYNTAIRAAYLDLDKSRFEYAKSKDRNESQLKFMMMMVNSLEKVHTNAMRDIDKLQKQIDDAKSGGMDEWMTPDEAAIYIAASKAYEGGDKKALNKVIEIEKSWRMRREGTINGMVETLNQKIREAEEAAGAHDAMLEKLNSLTSGGVNITPSNQTGTLPPAKQGSLPYNPFAGAAVGGGVGKSLKGPISNKPKRSNK